MEKGKVCLYCFLVIAAILGIVAFILTLNKKCPEGYFSRCFTLTEQKSCEANCNKQDA